MVIEKITFAYTFLRPKNREDWRHRAIKAFNLEDAYAFAKTLNFKEDELEVMTIDDLVDQECLDYVVDPLLRAKDHERRKKEGRESSME